MIQKYISSYFLNFYAKAKRCIKSKSFNRILSTYKNCVTVTVTIELLGNFPSYIPTLKSWHCSCDTKLREKQIQTFLPIFMIYIFCRFSFKKIYFKDLKIFFFLGITLSWCENLTDYIAQHI